MKRTAVKIVIDAYAWIEIFIGSVKGEKAKEMLEGASETYTPGTVLAEVARKYFREGVEQPVVLDRLKIVAEASDVTSISVEGALETARCYMQLLDEAEKAGLKTPSLFDAIVLATAKLLKAKVLTGDEHFRNLSETLWIGNPKRERQR